MIKTIFGEQKPTYFVFREGGGAPTQPHKSRFKAEKEAERLAQMIPGETFHVVKLKKSVRGLTDREVAEATAAAA